MFGRIGGGRNDKSSRGKEGSYSNHDVCYKGGVYSDKGRADGIYDYTGKSCGTSSYSSNTSGRGGDGSRSGGGDSGGSQSQSTGSEPKTHPSDSPQEKALAVNVAQKITPYVLALNPGEGSLGIYTASFSGRKSKDGDAISNQMKGCFSYLKIKGGIDTLRLLTFRECDLTEIDMIYFGNEMSKYSVLLKYLDFSYNRIGDLGTTYLFNSFFTYPTGQFAKHVVHLDLNNTGIGDTGAAHIAGYIKGGYMPATKVLNLADNNITDKGAVSLFETLKSESNRLKVLHLEGNNISSHPSYSSNTSGRGGDGSRSGGGDSGGSQSQSTGSEPKTHPSDSPQEKALAVNVAQKITPYVLALNPGEGSLGIYTASFSGRKSKDGDAISNQMKGCFSYLKIKGGIDTLRLLTFRECDLTEIDMIYFGFVA